MREFYELVGSRLGRVELTLRGPDVMKLYETSKFWAKMQFVDALECFHVLDEVNGPNENRVKIMTAGRSHHGGWVIMHSSGAGDVDWRLDDE